jgi:hypothetical protein
MEMGQVEIFMWKRSWVFIVALGLGGVAFGQSSGGEKKDYSQSPVFVKMMAMDKNKDGKLTRDEITDSRLLRLFDEADTNHDGVVTREELLALAAKLEAEVPAGSSRGGSGGGPGGFGSPPGGPDGFGGPPDGGPDGQGQGRGRGGPGGRGGFGPPPQPGQVLPARLQDELNLSDDQKKQIAELQKEVDAKLAKILTAEQLTQMKQMRGRGRGAGGPGGPGGDRGGPPGGPGQYQ